MIPKHTEAYLTFYLLVRLHVGLSRNHFYDAVILQIVHKSIRLDCQETESSHYNLLPEAHIFGHLVLSDQQSKATNTFQIISELTTTIAATYIFQNKHLSSRPIIDFSVDAFHAY